MRFRQPPIRQFVFLVITVCLAYAPLYLGAQTCEDNATQPPSSFEVATVKPTKQDNHAAIGLYVYPGGRIAAGQATLKNLVQYAFNVQLFQVQGGPAWTSEDLFEVSALPTDSSESRKYKPSFINAPPTDEQRRMLLSLLIERFGLKFHCTVKESQVYYLTKGKGPLLLQTAKRQSSFPILSIGAYGYGGMMGQSVSMAYMADRLSRYLEHQVLDQTSLQGLFDFKLDAATDKDEGASNENFVTGILRSVDQLGLKLKAGKGPVQVIIIDAATKPTRN